MSVLVKGMEMPTTCAECRLSTANNFNERPLCDALVEYMSYGEWATKRLDNCPLVPVPPHGRLIDADELMLMIQEYIDEYGWDVDEHGFHSEKWCAMKETEMAINDAPTVIPADKDGET